MSKQENLIVEYNNKTEQSYVKQGLKVPERLDFQIKNFLSEVDITKGDIEKTVTKIARIKAIDYTDKKKKQKEFMYWYENWNGKDWQSRKVSPVTDHVEGIYKEQEVEPIIERNKKTGVKRSGEHTIYYIPYTKEKVDELITNSIGTEKETIKYMIKTPTQRNDDFTYEQFTSLSFDECVGLMMKPGGPKFAHLAPTITTSQQQQQTETKQK